MKATKYIIGALAILLMAGSCKKNENTEATDFSASIEIDDSGKTELYDNTKVRWTQSDVIRVFGGTANDQKDYTLKSGFEHTQHGEFSCGSGGVKEGNDYWGFYPASLNPSRSGENISFTMPATQTAMNGGFATNLNPMAARVTDGSTLLPFKNLFGLLKIELTTNTTITKVELIDEHNALSGTFTVDASTLGSTSAGFNNMTITKPVVSATNKTLTLNCSATSGNLYFVIPPGALSQGFTVNFYRGTDGNSLVETKTISADPSLAMHSNQIKKMRVTANATLPMVTNLLPEVTPDKWGWYYEVTYSPTHPFESVFHEITYGVNNSYDCTAGNPIYATDPNVPGPAGSNIKGFAVEVHPNNTNQIGSDASHKTETFFMPKLQADYPELRFNHYYYIRWYTRAEKDTYNCSNGSPEYEVFWPVYHHAIVALQKNGITWEKHSALTVPLANSWGNNSGVQNNYKYRFRFDFNNDQLTDFGNAHFVFAAPMLIDLTADYNVQTPQQAQDLKSTLDGKSYFSGTINIDDWH